MVRPACFGMNPETAIDNVFQKSCLNPDLNVSNEALKEFETYVLKLIDIGINVIVVNDTKLPIKPDAIFPNNWFTTHTDGKVFFYPMKAKNRRLERQNPVLIQLEKYFNITNTIDLTEKEKENIYLEGSGSIIFNRLNNTCYACLSKRTNKNLFIEHANRLGLKHISFSAEDINGNVIYHTNVMMSVTSKFVIICLESIKDKQEQMTLKEHFRLIGLDIIEVTYDQMNMFCCNVLEVQNKNRQLYLTMSERAFKAFTQVQINQISLTHSILHSPLYTIEDIGGGGSRCMMAEVYLSKKRITPQVTTDS